MKQYIIFFLSLTSQAFSKEQNLPENSLTITHAFLSCEDVTVADTIITSSFTGNGEIILGAQKESTLSLGRYAPSQENESKIYLKNLRKEPAPAFYLILDSNNQLYKTQSIPTEKQKNNISIFNENLNAIHIETKEIDAPTSTLLLATYAPLKEESFPLYIGNSVGKITFSSPTILLGTEGIIFNEVSFDYETLFTDPVKTPLTLIGKTVTINDTVTATDSLSIQSQTIILPAVTLDGPLLHITGLPLYTQGVTIEATNNDAPFMIYLQENTTNKEGNFLVIDENDALKKTNLPPVQSVIKTNTIISPSQSSLTIIPLTNETQVVFGSSDSLLFLENTLLTYSTVPTIQGSSLTMTGTDKVICNDNLTLTVECPLPFLINHNALLSTAQTTTINTILAFSSNLSFPALPSFSQATYFLCFLQEGAIGYIGLIPKSAYEEALEEKKKTHKRDVSLLEQKMYRIKKIFYEEKEKYYKALRSYKKERKQYKKNKKIICFLEEYMP